MLPHVLPDLLHALFVLGLAAEAMTAALVAGRRNMDWLGVCIIACVTALGGGSLRDVLLGHYPLTWVNHPEYLWLTTGAALVTAQIAPVMHHLRRIFLFLDALGLVVFTVVGCQIAHQMHLPTTVILVSGMVTGCAGGVIRDVLCNNLPLLLCKELYASVSVVTGALYMIGCAMHLDLTLTTLGAMILGLTLRLLALRFDWHMPKFVYRHDWE